MFSSPFFPFLCQRLRRSSREKVSFGKVSLSLTSRMDVRMLLSLNENRSEREKCGVAEIDIDETRRVGIIYKPLCSKRTNGLRRERRNSRARYGVARYFFAGGED